ncbi:MAG TPA: hypothetical protein VFU45_02075 [Gemmatimonadales bacterium]|nr:hypothetical protein [Gemmatimonadales bacterium]
MPRKKLSTLTASLSLMALLGTTACGDTTTSPSRMQRAAITPLCATGCTDIDPYPDSAGVFLGSGITPSACTDGTDADADGLEDFCEDNLALAFAPELKYWDADEIGREPHLAVRPLDAGADSVRIAYLLSYYLDAGSAGGFLCSLFWVRPECEGHNGDSEAIWLDVYYHVTTQHWVLSRAEYSAHDGANVYARGAGEYPTNLEYPTHPGAYPRSWVSEGKHANYAHRSDCTGGGPWGLDTCADNNASARVSAGAYLNIGSNAHHLSTQDCMPSTNPDYEYYGSGRLECYWTNQRFRGWIPTWVGGSDSDPYSPKLLGHGF